MVKFRLTFRSLHRLLVLWERGEEREESKIQFESTVGPIDSVLFRDTVDSGLVYKISISFSNQIFSYSVKKRNVG